MSQSVVDGSTFFKSETMYAFLAGSFLVISFFSALHWVNPGVISHPGIVQILVVLFPYHLFNRPFCYNFSVIYFTPSVNGSSLKLVDKFTYLGSSVTSTGKDTDMQLTKAWTAIDKLSIIWKSDLTDKMKRSFFQSAVVSILQYGCTTWTLTKRPKKQLDGNYTRMLRAILNKSWRQHPTKHQLYGHLPPITKTIQITRTRHGGHC